MIKEIKEIQDLSASTRVSSKKLVKSSLTRKKSKSLPGLRGSLEKNEVKLPKLLEGWEWGYGHGYYAAFIFTWEYDCIVSIREGTLYLSTGVAPIEIVKAVLKANNLNHKYQTRIKSRSVPSESTRTSLPL
jgi:hypothetical protein